MPYRSVIVARAPSWICRAVTDVLPAGRDAPWAVNTTHTLVMNPAMTRSLFPAGLKEPAAPGECWPE